MKIRHSRVKHVERSMIVGEDDTFLFVKRASNDPYLPGLWEFPGGKVEKEKGESLEQGRDRETHEETGLLTRPLGIEFVHEQENTSLHRLGGLTLYKLRTSVCEIVGGELDLKRDELSDAVMLNPAEAHEKLQLTTYCAVALDSLATLLEQSRTSR